MAAPLQSLPASAIPLDFRYPRGISLCGVSSIITRVPATGPDTLPFLRFRLYLRIPADAKTAPDLYLAPGYAENGAIIYKYPIPLRKTIDPAAPPVAAGRIMAADVELPILSHLPDGATYDISLDLQTSSGRRLYPRDPSGAKIRHLILPLSHTIRR